MSNPYISADLARLRQRDDIRAAQAFRAAHVDEPDDAGWRVRLLEWARTALGAQERSGVGVTLPYRGLAIVADAPADARGTGVGGGTHSSPHGRRPTRGRL